ncbi:DUF1996 domain-containing protein [Streptomyces sp. WI04-05B]|uniref:DUF1996 domain-containing protein n=1 Tax=Streptomyces TaxID=1883 RepID=UPI0029B176A6|nr:MULTISPECIES: DUF1996 domain-containing protein [unclassified Streptomyces]MDX2543543.1 DUF1996 domain-containing protein [Streptomyces sp. WI04-05B]MDX2582969.1 DUF1996 domain-containing protein [Streptomyces sp. WI04-05A]MDX3746716.1 DUF1996 domain-containing protein [Streptomyces sp. AK08-02]
MRRNMRKRSKTTRRAVAAAAGLALGAGGLIAVNVYASAHEGGDGGSSYRASQGQPNQVLAAGATTIGCPDVRMKLTGVPDRSREQVDRELALLDQQVAEAYQRLRNSARAIQQDRGFADNAIMGPLRNKRAATIDRIAIAIGRSGVRPQGLEALAACSLRTSGNQQGTGQGQGQGQGNGAGQNGNGGNGGNAGNGPVAADFVDITKVQPNVRSPRPSRGASKGTFTTRCGVNANKLYNSDNIIVAPGVTNGAHHTHDYVGNQDNDAFTTNEEFAAAATSCRNQGDKSTYYWPVLRLQDGTREFDAKRLGGGAEGNTGRILTASRVTLNFVGSPRGKVVAMPKFLRIITGDAKAFTNGTANANAAWSCTGFEDRQLTDRYPICPRGSSLVRTSSFQSCWDGQNIDSANHRTHVAFADRRTGACPTGFKAIPQLVQRLVYDVKAPSLGDNGKTSPFYAVDGFPEQTHKPITDHGDFINVFDDSLMNQLVQCVNTGRKCR